MDDDVEGEEEERRKLKNFRVHHQFIGIALRVEGTCYCFVFAEEKITRENERAGNSRGGPGNQCDSSV